jgi:hypothetical protein
MHHNAWLYKLFTDLLSFLSLSLFLSFFPSFLPFFLFPSFLFPLSLSLSLSLSLFLIKRPIANPPFCIF